MLDLIKFIFLGFVQGITEPIPVSSSGHLLIFQKLVGSFDNIDFEILATITNLGSFLAIFFIFRKDIVRLFKAFFGYLGRKDKKLYMEDKLNRTMELNNIKKQSLKKLDISEINKQDDYKYCWYVIIGTIPAGIMGIIVTKLKLFDVLEENIKFVGITLIVTAIFLFIIRNFKGRKDDKDITIKDAVIIGLFQVIALLPGISRSGATIVGGMFRDLKRKTAFNFSFMLYIPISLATTLLGIKDLFEANLDFITIVLYFISMVVAFIFTYIGTKWFRKVVNEGKLIYFTVYCLIVGILVLLFL